MRLTEIMQLDEQNQELRNLNVDEAYLLISIK